jgi:hypothetical protein
MSSCSPGRIVFFTTKTTSRGLGGILKNSATTLGFSEWLIKRVKLPVLAASILNW